MTTKDEEDLLLAVQHRDHVRGIRLWMLAYNLQGVNMWIGNSQIWSTRLQYLVSHRG